MIESHISIKDVPEMHLSEDIESSIQAETSYSLVEANVNTDIVNPIDKASVPLRNTGDTGDSVPNNHDHDETIEGGDDVSDGCLIDNSVDEPNDNGRTEGEDEKTGYETYDASD